MAQTIKLKRSATSGATPTTSQLELGEVAINTYDGKMYIKKNVSGTESIVEIGGSAGSSTLSGLSDVTISSAAADQLLQYNGSEWVNVSIAEASAIMKEYQFTATSGQSTFSGSDDNSETLSYTAGAIQVFLNGIFLDSAVDYTATNGTSIVLSETVDANDYLQVVAFKKKIGDGNVSVDTFTGDNSTTAFTLSVDPGDENNTRVFVDGVYQSKSNYSVSGTTLTFSTAPPTDTAVEVEIGNRVVTLDTLSDLDLPDDVKLRLGTDQDLQIYHDGSNGFIKNTTGDLYIEDSNGSIRIRPKTGESGINVLADSSVELYYDNSKKLETSNDGVTVTGDVEADEFIGDVRGAVLFKAQAGETLAKGEVVYISGISGNTTIVSKADADDASKMPAFGLVAAAASSGNPVDIYTNGILSDIDTSSYSEGDELFVSTTAGALTATAPTGESAALQKIGKVTRSNATSGSIFIVGAGRSNAVPNLDDGDIFIGNASNQAVTASLNTKIEDYLDGGTSTPSLASLAVDSITIDGTEIDSSSSLILDIAGNLTVNVDGTTVTLADDTINFGQFYNNASGQFNIYAPTQDKDIVFLGNDGGSTVTALTLDMSDGGTAILASHLDMGDNQKIRLGASDDLQLFHDGSNSYIQNGTTGNINITNTAGGEFVLVGVANGGTFLYHDGTSKFQTTSTGVDITGTVTADGLTFGTNHRIQGTGILFLGGSSATAFEVGAGSEKMRLTSTGLGIGTQSPGTSLHIANSGNSFLTLERTSPASGTGKFGINIESNSQTTIAYDNSSKIVIGRSSNPQTQAGFSNDFVFDSNGRFGIGTTSPTAAIHATTAAIGYTAKFINTNNASDSNGLLIQAGTGSTEYALNVANTAGTTNFMVVKGDGNVGIGVTSPNDGRLQVYNNNSGDWAGYFWNQNTNGIGLHVETNSYGTEQLLRLSSLSGSGGSNVVRMAVLANGNVGIGTASPAAPLHVKHASGEAKVIIQAGSNTSSAVLQFGDSLDSSRGGIEYTSTDDMAFSTNNMTEAMRIRYTGNVGIGTTSPQEKLQINGNLRMFSTGYPLIDIGITTSNYFRFLHDNPNDIFKIGKNGAATLNIAGSGNVGIGNDAPSSLLSVGKVPTHTPGSVFTSSPSSFFSTTTLGGTTGNSQKITIFGGADASNVSGLALYRYRRSTGTNWTTDGFSLRQEVDGTANIYDYINFAGGNVGIGTTSPSAKLHVNAGEIRIASSSAYNTHLNYQDTGVNIISQANSGTTEIRNSSSTLFYLNASGKVGIGTTAPNEMLQIDSADSAIRVNTTNAVNNSELQLIYNNSTNGMFFRYHPNSALAYIDNTYPRTQAQAYGDILFRQSYAGTMTEHMRLTAYDGYLGVFTSTPKARLELNLHSGADSSLMNGSTTNDVQLLRAGYGQNAGTTSNAGAKWGLRFVGRNDNTFDTTKSGAIYAVSEDALGYNREVGLAFHTSAFDSNHAERMRIDADGNLLIGTTTASAKLYAKTGATGVITKFEGPSGRYVYSGTDSGGHYMEVVGTQASERVLRIQGNNGSGTYTQLFINAGTQNIYTSSNASVGIGTASPVSLLHIKGSGTYNHTPANPQGADFVITSSEMGDNNAHSIMQLVSVRQSLTTGSGSTGYLGFSTMDDSNNAGINDAARIAIVNEAGSSVTSATALSFWTNAGGSSTGAATERMRITSAGELQLTGNGVLRNQESGGNFSYLQQTSSDARLFVQYSQPLLFGTNNTERMRIDTSGNVTIGSSTLSADAALKFQADTGTFTLNHDRGVHALVLSDSDGTGEILRVDTSGNLLVGRTGHSGYGVANFEGGIDVTINPIYARGGGIYIGGVASANLLDDYEEGTWTPSMSGMGNASFTTYGRYTKVGNLVYVTGKIAFTGKDGTNNVAITGLPFAPANAADSQDRASAYPEGDYQNINNLIDNNGHFRITSSSTLEGVIDNGSGYTAYMSSSNFSSSGEFNFHVTYRSS